MIRSRQRPRVGGGSGASGSLALRLDFMSSTSLDQRVTFSRGTNATLIDSTGQLTYAPSNQLLNSESFGATSWTKSSSTITSNVIAAPDGTLTADKIVTDSTAASAHSVGVNIAAQNAVNYAYSLYVKAAELTQVALLLPATPFGTVQVIFDLASVSPIGTIGSPLWTSIVAVGNGWYRIGIGAVATSSASGFTQVRLAKSGNVSFDGNGTDGLYIWGAQFGAMTYETAPRAYNSTSPKNLLGFTEEFNNAGWTKANAIIQTNLLIYSEQFDNTSGWSTTNINAPTANADTAPNGTLTADKIIPNATSSLDHWVSSNTTVVIGTQYTVSVYAKAAGYNYVLIRGLGFGTGGGAVFNLATGVMENKNSWSSASITNVGNGWYRCVATGVSASINGGIFAVSNEPTYTVPFAGDGTSGIYLWGAQLVQGATAGNYQQTIAAAAAIQYADSNGYLNAEKLVEDTATNEHFVDQPFTAISATTYTYSAYAKAGERNQIVLRFAVGTVFVGGSVQVAFTLTGSGSSFTISGSPTAQSITAVGNGWYRCSISVLTVAAVAATPSVRIHLYDGTSSNYTGNGTSGAYIWGAQLSDSASVDPYVYNPAAALTSTAYYGPRFEYDPAFTYSTNNLIPYANPQNFSNASFWTKARASAPATTATADPSGASTAYKLTEDNSVNLTHLIQWQGVNTAVTAGVQYTFSGYVKLADAARSAVQVAISTDNGAFTLNGGTIDLITGAVSGVTGATPIVTDVGNGWWRWSITATATASALCTLRIQLVAGGTNSYTGDGTSGAYIWGAQLTESAAAVPFYYYPYTPLGLLIEEARTNLLLNSQTLSTQNITTTAQAYTLSFYGTGTVTLTGTSVAGPLVGTGVFPNRVSLTFTPTAGTLTLTVSGTVSNAQLEAGAFATSYIPTVSASATRSADIATMVGNNFSNWYNQTAGTLAVSFNASANSQATYVSASNGTITQNSVHIDNEAGNMRAVYYSGGTAVATIGLTAIGTVGAVNRIATAYAVNDFAASRNGGAVVTDSAGALPVSLTQLNIGTDDRLSAIYYTSNHIKSISYYNTRLPDAQLQAITL